MVFPDHTHLLFDYKIINLLHERSRCLLHLIILCVYFSFIIVENMQIQKKTKEKLQNVFNIDPYGI